MKQMIQYRYYGKDNDLTEGISIDDDKEYYELDYTQKPIYQLGIQSVPGFEFYLNDAENPIIIGASGIYQLDLTNTSARVVKIKIKKEQLEKIDGKTSETTSETISYPVGYLIIDLVYEGGD